MAMTWTYQRWYLDGQPLNRNIRKRIAKKWMKSGRLVLVDAYPIDVPGFDPAIDPTPTGELITVTAVDPHNRTVTVTRGYAHTK